MFFSTIFIVIMTVIINHKLNCILERIDSLSKDVDEIKNRQQ